MNCYNCKHCPRSFSSSNARGQHEHKQHPVEENNFRIRTLLPASKKTVLPVLVGEPRVMVETYQAFQMTDEEKQQEKSHNKEVEAALKLFYKGLETETTETGQPNRSVSGPSKRSQTPQSGLSLKGLNMRERHAVLDRAWRSAFRSCRKTTIDRILRGVGPFANRTIPEGSKVFWQGIFHHEDDVNLEVLARTITLDESDLYNTLCAEITNDEVKDALGRIKNNTTPGPDQVNKSKVFSSGIDPITKLLNVFLSKSRIPKSSKRSTMFLIPKSDNAVAPSDHRPISVGDLVKRILCSILMARTPETLEFKHGQRGFKRGEEGVFLNLKILQQVIVENIRHFQTMSYCFLDITKAFDSVYHSELIKVLAKLGVPRKLLMLVASMYSGASVNLQNGESIRIKRGVLQGDPLSPLFFNLVLDDALDSVRDMSKVGMGFTKKKKPTLTIGHLAYADDIVLFAKNDAHLKQKINILSERLQTYGLKINASKSRVCHLVFPNRTMVVNNMSTETCTIDGKEIQQMNLLDRYTYLGVQISATGNLLPPCVEDFKLKLQRMEHSHLEAHQKIESIREVLVGKFVTHLDMAKSDQGTQQKFDMALKAVVRRILGLPTTTADVFLYAHPQDGGLGIPSIPDLISRSNTGRYWRFVDVLSKYGSDRYGSDPEVKVIAQKLSSHNPLYNVNANLSKLSSLDGEVMRNHLNATEYKSRWVFDPPHWVPGWLYKHLVQTRIGTLKTPNRLARKRVKFNGKVVSVQCPFCTRNPMGGTNQAYHANQNHITSHCVGVEGMITKRHDKVLQMVSDALKKLKKYDNFKKESLISGSSRDYKPDLVFQKPFGKTRRDDSITYVVEFSIRTCLCDLDKLCTSVPNRYNVPSVHTFVKDNYEQPTKTVFVGVILDNRGCWSDKSFKAMIELGLTVNFLERISIEVLHESHKIVQAYNSKFNNQQAHGSSRSYQSPRP